MRHALWLTLALGCSLTSTAPQPVAARPAVETRSAPAPAPAPAPEVVPSVVRVTAGARDDARLPMIVAVHGLGDRPEDFVTLFDALPFPARVVALRGITPFGDGFSWFPPGDADRDPTAFLAATDAVARAITALAARHPTCGRPVLTGFSQGGMLTFAVAVREPGIIRGAVPIAGRLPAALVQAHYPSRIVPEVTALHGMDDRRIAFEQGDESVRALRRMGFAVTMRPFAGVGHAVPQVVRSALFDELRRLTAGECSR